MMATFDSAIPSSTDTVVRMIGTGGIENLEVARLSFERPAPGMIRVLTSAAAIASTISSSAHGAATYAGPALAGPILALANVAYTDSLRAILLVLAVLAILTAANCLLTLRDEPPAVPAIDA